MFLRNCWYVAAFTHEIGEKPFARTILGEPVVLFRAAKGKYAALEDRCCHRQLPLSHGEITADGLACGYHGMTYDTDGICVRIPCQNRVPAAARVRSYPVVVRYGVVWIWMGDPALAASEEIVPYPWHEDAGWLHKCGYILVRGNHELINDNLLDLSHVGFVHRRTIGGDAELHARAEMRTTRNDSSVRVERWVRDVPPPPTWSKAGGYTGNFDRWQTVDFHVGLIRIYIGTNETGREIDTVNQKSRASVRIFNGITPETESSTHYFWSVAHDFALHDPDVTEWLRGEIAATFVEDQEICEAQQRTLERLPGRNQIHLSTDAGGIHARRIISIRTAAEHAGSRQIELSA